MIIQKDLLENGNSKDYFIMESLLKGNNLLKQKWRKDVVSGKQPVMGSLANGTLGGVEIQNSIGTNKDNKGLNKFK